MTPDMVNAAALEWGWKGAKMQAPALWGARAYIQTERQVRYSRFAPRRELRIPFDRQSAVGERAAADALLRQLNAVGGGLAVLREQLNEYREVAIYPDQQGETKAGGVLFEYYFRGGYLLLTARLETR